MCIRDSYNTLTSNLPDPSKLQKVEQDFQTTRILDRTGKLLYEVIDETAGDRQWVKYDDISPYLRCAVVASEDRRFYETEGVDLRGLARAVLNNLQGGVTQGASGISQDVYKRQVENPERMFRLPAPSPSLVPQALVGPANLRGCNGIRADASLHLQKEIPDVIVKIL